MRSARAVTADRELPAGVVGGHMRECPDQASESLLTGQAPHGDDLLRLAVRAEPAEVRRGVDLFARAGGAGPAEVRRGVRDRGQPGRVAERATVSLEVALGEGHERV